MKKSASLLLVLLLALFSFTACGGEESSSVVSSIASAPPSSSVLESSLLSSSLPESTTSDISAVDLEWQYEVWECFFEMDSTSFEGCFIHFWSKNEIEVRFGVFESESDYAYEGSYYWDEDKLVIDAVETFRGVFEEEIEDPATLHTVLQVEDNGNLTYTVTLVEGDPLHPYHEYGVPETYYHRKLMYDPKNPPVEIIEDWVTFYLDNDDIYWFFLLRLWDDGSAKTAYGPFESEADWAFAGEYSWLDENTLQLTLKGDYGVYKGEERHSTLQMVGKDDHTVGITLLEGDALIEAQQMGIEELYYDNIHGFYNPVLDTWTPRG